MVMTLIGAKVGPKGPIGNLRWGFFEFLAISVKRTMVVF